MKNFLYNLAELLEVAIVFSLASAPIVAAVLLIRAAYATTH